MAKEAKTFDFSELRGGWEAKELHPDNLENLSDKGPAQEKELTTSAHWHPPNFSGQGLRLFLLGVSYMAAHGSAPMDWVGMIRATSFGGKQRLIL
eukprot:6473412-Amphidinium_carterae.4